MNRSVGGVVGRRRRRTGLVAALSLGLACVLAACAPPPVDRTPPQLRLPVPRIYPATSHAGGVVDITVTAIDLVDGDVPVSCSPEPGTFLPIGEHEVSCSSADSRGNEATATFTITVRDMALEVRASSHTCARMSVGELRCWGANHRSQLGDRTTTPSSVPLLVDGVADVVSVDVGEGHTCVARGDGSVWCWGANESGQLGRGSTSTSSPDPAPVVGVAGAVAVDVGYAHSCALLASGAVACWGANGSGRLGDGTTSPSAVAVAVAGLPPAAQISASNSHTCAVAVDRTVRCWGANAMGQLGDGSLSASADPVVVEGLAAVEVSSMYDVTCAVRVDARVACWGSGGIGQLGHGANLFRSPVPVTVHDLDEVEDLAVGTAHSCAVITSGAVRCWGQGSQGQLGDGMASSSNVPVEVAGDDVATAVGAGGSHSCRTTRDGDVDCWGANPSGQLGDGTTMPSTTPVRALLAASP
jgi:alpha-tubulin suppressor-like RCC1 family protein